MKRYPKSRTMLAAGASALWLLSTAQGLPPPDRGGAPLSSLYDYGIMGPPATPAIVADALVGLPDTRGPYRAEWSSLAAWRPPAWLAEAKLGVFIHWGLFSVPAYRNEWYEKHMYAADREWHAARFGPQERFGYKDFIPRFTASRWSPDEWAALFGAAGARFVVQPAQHHDNFALWDSRVTPFNSVAMGPRRDLVGDLTAALRRRGLKVGLANHGIENFTFINPDPTLDKQLRAAGADLYDPRWGAFYNVADRGPRAMTRFLRDWGARNIELIDRYRPDLLWFDNGINLRVLDPLKRHVAAYYYNAAARRRQPVAIVGKYIAFAPSNDDRAQTGAVIDFEKVGKRSPPAIRPGPWLVDDPIGSTWGYTDGMTVAGAPEIIRRLADTIAKGGTYLLNVSPRADGSIPDDQRATLTGIGRWLAVNREAVFGTRPWCVAGEGGRDGVRFTTRGGAIYAIVLQPRGAMSIAALGRRGAGVIRSARLLTGANVPFRQDETALSLSLDTGNTPVVVRLVRQKKTHSHNMAQTCTIWTLQGDLIESQPA